jgi:hypothetical protein
VVVSAVDLVLWGRGRGSVIGSEFGFGGEGPLEEGNEVT